MTAVITTADAEKWFATSELYECGEGWAQDFMRTVVARSAKSDRVKTSPTLMISGAALVKDGVTEAELASLHALTPVEISELQLEADALREDWRAQVRTLARRIAQDRDTAVSAPEPCSLTALLDEPESLAQYVIDGVWPAGGRVMLAAQYKAGKSTTVGNAIRSLVDGDPFLDVFPVSRVNRVALIDTELDRHTLRRWLRDQGIRNSTAVTVVPLRGAVSTFDILDPHTRSEWAQRLAGTDVVILDCLRPVLDALGLSEDKDAGKLLVAFDALLAEIGATEGMVVTHMGHQNERARGDSRLLDWPDANWKIIKDGNDDGARRSYFTADGRDVSVPEGVLTFDAATRHLSFGCGGRHDAASSAAIPQLLEMVATAPGELSKNAVERRLREDHGVSQKNARDTIKRAIKDGLVTVAPGPNRADLLSPVADPVPQPTEIFNFIPDYLTGSEGR